MKSVPFTICLLASAVGLSAMAAELVTVTRVGGGRVTASRTGTGSPTKPKTPSRRRPGW